MNSSASIAQILCFMCPIPNVAARLRTAGKQMAFEKQASKNV